MGHVLSDMEICIERPKCHTGMIRFNWATSFRTWKCFALFNKIQYATGEFQLGHVLSDMEIREYTKKKESRK